MRQRQQTDTAVPIAPRPLLPAIRQCPPTQYPPIQAYHPTYQYSTSPQVTSPVSSTSKSPSPQTASSAKTTAVSRRKSYTTAACETCRKRKVKCNGARPACNSCVSSGVSCLYNTSNSNETHGQALKRKLFELGSREATFKQIFDHLRDRPEPEVLEIVKRIRSGTDPDTILRYIKEGDLLLQLAVTPETRFRYHDPFLRTLPRYLVRGDNPYLRRIKMHEFELPTGLLPSPQMSESSLSSPASAIALESPYTQPYHAAELIEPFLSSAKPSEWTTVCADDELMRKLLAFYFLNEYQWFPVFQKDYFLQDMATGRQGCCSSLLVNCVLAIATAADQTLQNRNESAWNPKTLGWQFLAEAKRLWDIEEASGRIRLTTIQASVLLNLVHIMHAADATGTQFTQKGVAMAQRVGLFNPGNTKLDTRMARAKAFTAWALFNFQAMYAYVLHERPQVKQPPSIPLPDPNKDPSWYGQIRLRYPQDQKAYSAHFPLVFKAMCDVRAIMNSEWLEVFGRQDPKSTIPLDRVHSYYMKLKQWFDNLPTELSPENITLPSQLLLHINYHIIVKALYEPYCVEEMTTPISSPSHNITGNIGIEQLNPRQIRDAALRHFETLIRIYYIRHGFSFFDSFIGQPLVHLGFIVLNRLKGLLDKTANTTYVDPTDIQELQSTLLLAAKGLNDQGQNMILGLITLHVLTHLMDNDTKTKLGQVIGEVKYVPGCACQHCRKAHDDPTAHRLRSAVPQSRLIMRAESFVDDRDAQTLGGLVTQMKHMDLKDSKVEPDEEEDGELLQVRND